MAEYGEIRRLWALDAPQLTVDRGLLVVGAGGEPVTIPAPSFLIEHDEGLMIFDTGLAADGAGDPAAAYGPVAEAFQIDFPAEHRLDRQIEALGFQTSDVRQVIISHLHFDHTGGLVHFPGAEGFIGAGEMRYARTADPVLHGFFREQDLDAAAKIRWRELPAGYDHDVFGDGSVTLLSLPGHTPGSLGLGLRFQDRYLVLSGDSAHLHGNVDATIGMTLDADTVGKLDSLRKLRLLESRPDTTLWVNHDPADWQEYRANGKEVSFGR
ncbi:N-acyl homoserine lactonase family protein [Saccharopolyspora sp. WRP15-2]|uniref:N-acyl homoserine lactonase family protein n=1 Tax=Saccharopolyspora oryzae TaxID=2997343 RepID=A0ABT4USM3_9PSEU|nr:N-acyl homoserine lactonase family protein [Saccharopolyspora oryzae]MDA3624077.1 N-acyl homoserine lactonase family protein [Saccharopolyspora oryzae]